VKYCLDTNVFIQAWNGYYAIDLCSDYWEQLDKFALEGVILSPEEVAREISHIDDELYAWIKDKDYFFRPIDEEVQRCLQIIFSDEKHHRLVDSSKFRSAADPWVIAHAMAEKAVVVTKESYEINKTKRIKIPNVCETMGIECINDFELLRRLGLKLKVTGRQN